MHSLLSRHLPRLDLCIRPGGHICRRVMHVDVAHDITEAATKVEEETVRGYNARHYYFTRPAEIFRDRYQVIRKLGYGSASTVWLC